MSTSEESLKETGRCAAASIVEMVAALECDYDRLEELKEELAACDETASQNACNEMHAAFEETYGEEFRELKAAADECKDREEAEQRIQEDALSVEVRSDWHAPQDGAGTPTEFNILLSTGGPASRIMGELDEHGQPDRAWLEVQDWGTPWTRYYDISQDTLLAYARCFYFGEG